MLKAPFYPIIYVRGYAMTATERDDATADPFCGFNVGSAVYRASVDKKAPARKLIFESPLLRLISDFQYEEVFENGCDIMDDDWKPRRDSSGHERKGISARSVIIHRYYEGSSSLLGDEQAKPIAEYSQALSKLIARVRERVMEGEGIPPEAFKCYLVAHSMGGLVARGMLQNPANDPENMRGSVAKFFTYATPHNGIDVVGLNVPSWLSTNEINTFNRDRIAGLTGMPKVNDRVDFMPASAMPIENVFCMVGTNRADYDVAAGLSRTFVGHGSDGLVKICNASLWGLDDHGAVTQPAATAFAYRSHSGYFGIVNSEEAYQNLTRFLFGDVRVDLWLQVQSVRLPADIEQKQVEALYQFEVLARPKGKPWLLTRRLAEEDSPTCRTHKDVTDPAQPGARLVYLSTVFLANAARMDKDDPSLTYAMDVAVRVPDYVVERKLWLDGHFEGSYLFRDSLVVRLAPPLATGDPWQVTYGWQSQTGTQATQPVAYKDLGAGKFEIRVPFENAGKPGISGEVLLSASAWNPESN